MLKRLFISFIGSILCSLLLAVFHNVLITSQDISLVAEENGLAHQVSDPYNMRAVSEKVNVSDLEALNVKLVKGDSFRSVEETDPRSLNQCIATVSAALKALPREHTYGLKKLTLSFDPLARRGLAGGNEMIIRCVGMEEDELMAVVVHEMGHIVDTGVNLIGNPTAGRSTFYDGDIPVYNNDPSTKFYYLSFDNYDTKSEFTANMDFVSIYAETDVFEDFAETYTYYVLHGNAFRKLTETNQVLAKKYEFMKEGVFNGKEYGIMEEEVDYFKRNYDTTVLSYEKGEFLNNKWLSVSYIK